MSADPFARLMAGKALKAIGAGTGDMTKAVYDTNNDGVVDAAAIAPWSGITSKPNSVSSIAALTPAADKIAYYTGAATASLVDISSFGRTFIAYTDATTAFTNIKQDATSAATGVIQLATSAETNTGTDAAKAVTPSTLAAKKVKDWISVLIEKPDNLDYVIARNLPVGCTVNSVTTKCASGTCTVTGKINSTAFGGTANSVSSTVVTQTHSSANVAGAGDALMLTVSSNSNCLRLEVTVAITRALGT